MDAPRSLCQRRIELKRELLQRIEKRNIIAALRGSLVEEQIKFLDDPARNKGACCSRRAGKTFGIVRGILLKGVSTDRAQIIACTDTRDHMKKLVWDELLDTAADLKINLRANHNELVIRFPNKSRAWLHGVPNLREAVKTKGFHYHLAIIDEAQDIREEVLQYLMDVALGPGLSDYQGTMLITGTPGEIHSGRWYNISSGKADGWKTFSWKQTDNPRFPAWAHLSQAGEDWRSFARGYIQAEILARGLTMDDPKVRREYFGEWDEDKQRLIYSVFPDSAVAQLPGRWIDGRLVMAIDLGYHEEAAWSVCCLFEGKVYQVFEHRQSKMSFSDIIEFTRSIYTKYQRDGSPDTPSRTAIELTLLDPSGGGNNMAEEVRQRFGLPAMAASKKDKRDYYILSSNAIQQGQAFVLPGTAAQLRSLRWDAKRMNAQDIGPQGLSDSWLYAWRYLSLLAAKPVKPVSESEAEQIRLRRLQQIRADRYAGH